MTFTPVLRPGLRLCRPSGSAILRTRMTIRVSLATIQPEDSPNANIASRFVVAPFGPRDSLATGHLPPATDLESPRLTRTGRAHRRGRIEHRLVRRFLNRRLLIILPQMHRLSAVAHWFAPPESVSLANPSPQKRETRDTCAPVRPASSQDVLSSRSARFRFPQRRVQLPTVPWSEGSA